MFILVAILATTLASWTLLPHVQNNDSIIVILLLLLVVQPLQEYITGEYTTPMRRGQYGVGKR